MRHRLTSTIAVFFVLFLFMGCSRDLSPLTPTRAQPLTSLEKRLVSKSNVFGFNLFKEIVRQDKAENIFVSPLSVSLALGMTLNGAAGETENAMKTTLGFGDLSLQTVNETYKSLIAYLLQLDPKVILKLANSIWYRNTFHFESSFFDVTRHYFGAEVQGLDFSNPASIGIVNSWVDQHTNGKIKKILDFISPEDVLFLINAVYFKGMWTYQFKKEATHDADFYLPDGSSMDVKMMNQAGTYDYFETDRFQAIDLPYGNGMFSMAIFLPKPGISLDSLIAQLSPETWVDWMGRFEQKKGSIWLPKFKLKYQITLNAVLKSLGMGIAFSDLADFTRMSQSGGLSISYVRHKTFVKVDEEGTEAAAVTVVGMRATSIGGSEGFEMIVNRPFLCVIRERQSNGLLFVGKITRPNWEE